MTPGQVTFLVESVNYYRERSRDAAKREVGRQGTGSYPNR